MLEESRLEKGVQGNLFPSEIENSFQDFDEFYGVEEDREASRSLHALTLTKMETMENGGARGGPGSIIEAFSEQNLKYFSNYGLLRASVQNQSLNRLPEEIAMHTKIAELNLSSNFLCKIDRQSEVSSFLLMGKTLQRLSISNNILVELTRDLFASCQNLVFLDLSANLLRDISFLEGLTSLKELDIRQNRILYLDRSFSSLTSLSILQFDWPSLISPRLTGASQSPSPTTISLVDLRSKASRQSVYDVRHFTVDFGGNPVSVSALKSYVRSQNIFMLALTDFDADLLEYAVTCDAHRSVIALLDRLNEANSNTR